MSQFHIAIAGNYLTMTQVDSGYTIERNLSELPKEAVEDLQRIFFTKSFKKAHWTRVAYELGLGSELKHYFLYEKAEEKRRIEEEYEIMSAMAKYADCLPSRSLEVIYG